MYFRHAASVFSLNSVRVFDGLILNGGAYIRGEGLITGIKNGSKTSYSSVDRNSLRGLLTHHCIVILRY